MDDDVEEESRYASNPYASSSNRNFRSKLPFRNSSFLPPMVRRKYTEEDDEEEDDEHQVVYERDQQVHHDDHDSDTDDDDGKNYSERVENVKRRKLDKIGFGYEFAPRVKTPSVSTMAVPKNSPSDWSEHATFVLLDAWGERFLQLGRKSLRSDEWLDVANKVSQASKSIRTDAQCRNRLDTLKKNYKREKMKMSENGNYTSKWVYFKKMDMLMTSPPRHLGLSCGLDSGEYVFMNPRVYLNRSNGLDEMRDSPGNSESSDDGEDDDSEGLPPEKVKNEENGTGNFSSFKLLVDSIQKFGEIYEKIENTKRKHMIELEKLRMEFHRDLELQKRQIFEKAHSEIAKIRQGYDEEIDESIETTSE